MFNAIPFPLFSSVNLVARFLLFKSQVVDRIFAKWSELNAYSVS